MRGGPVMSGNDEKQLFYRDRHGGQYCFAKRDMSSSEEWEDCQAIPGEGEEGYGCVVLFIGTGVLGLAASAGGVLACFF